jgi:hypothetical protein
VLRAGHTTLLFALLVSSAAHADSLPDTKLDYRIRVRIDPSTRRITGEERLRWVNPSDAAVQRVPLHLYLNAFSHLGTTWMREAEESYGARFNPERFLAMYPDPWGWIDPSIEQVSGGERTGARWRPIQPDDGNRLDRSLIEVTLPRPVAPGETLELRIRFKGRLPEPVARTGCTPEHCMVVQWFPKIAVLEVAGVRHAEKPRWAARQFHAATEFYADFADYDVTIEAPRGWIIGATGKQQGEAGSARGGFQSVRYTQRAVHDFAFVLGRDLHDVRTVYRPRAKGATPIAVRYLLPRAHAHQVKGARRAIERALDLYARRVGVYPYETLTVVLPPYRARRTGGMEYPTLITGMFADPLWERFPLRHFHAQELVLVHELGHEYFYGLLATNEQEEAFLDEGFTAHFEGQCLRALYGQRGSAGWMLGRPLDNVEFYRFGLTRSRHRIREPLIRRPSALYYPRTQGLHNYNRGALTLWTAANRFGLKKVNRVFTAYYRRHRFGHPDVDDFLEVARESSGAQMSAFLSEAFSRERIPDFRVVSVTSRRFTAPLGRITDEKGSFVVKEESREAALGRLTTARMRDQNDRVWVEITDPGWNRGGGKAVYGRTFWHGFQRKNAGKPRSSDRLYESRARITGPAWDNLPATVLLRFEDGVEVRERWDARAAWRGYRVVRPARLVEVRIDEQHRVVLDVVPQNNGQALEADRRFLADWGGWLGAAVQWLAGGLSLWL